PDAEAAADVREADDATARRQLEPYLVALWTTHDAGDLAVQLIDRRVGSCRCRRQTGDPHRGRLAQSDHRQASAQSEQLHAFTCEARAKDRTFADTTPNNGQRPHRFDADHG